MTVRIRNELPVIIGLVLGLVLVITLIPDNILRIVLGIPFVVFIPGYTLVSALFPRGENPGNIERIALAFGLSFFVVPLACLVLNFTTWGILLYPVLIFLSVFIITSSLVAWYRRRRLTETERFSITIALRLPAWRGTGRVGQVLMVVLLVTMLGATGVLVFVAAMPAERESFTEFLIIGEDGRLGNYPEELKTGDTATVTAVIISHEGETTTYLVETDINGERVRMSGPFVLGPGEETRQVIDFTMEAPGPAQRVDFILHKDEVPGVRLFLFVDVSA